MAKTDPIIRELFGELSSSSEDARKRPPADQPPKPSPEKSPTETSPGRRMAPQVGTSIQRSNGQQAQDNIVGNSTAAKASDNYTVPICTPDIIFPS
ncbi:hypothetical protein EAG_01384 [Camponotus floridanus]|uniref:Uncharacterized protein n=1 Tax=Camponotus floridanus TaxID=104421 RepID=E2APW8_CAMFO|nr:hypothetical protein EAG_01384 [Camponotus floridanus]